MFKVMVQTQNLRGMLEKQILEFNDKMLAQITVESINSKTAGDKTANRAIALF